MSPRRPTPPPAELHEGAHVQLAHDVETNWGYYAQGEPVKVLQLRGAQVAVCLDDGVHLRNTRCHAAVLERDDLA